MPVRMKKELIHCQALGEAQEIRVRIGRRIHIITEREDYEVVSGTIPDLITAADIRKSRNPYRDIRCLPVKKN